MTDRQSRQLTQLWLTKCARNILIVKDFWSGGSDFLVFRHTAPLSDYIQVIFSDDCKLCVTFSISLWSVFMDDIKSILSDFHNNFLKLLIFHVTKNDFAKWEPVNEWNAGSIAHVFSPNWLLNKETLLGLCHLLNMKYLDGSKGFHYNWLIREEVEWRHKLIVM